MSQHQYPLPSVDFSSEITILCSSNFDTTFGSFLYCRSKIHFSCAVRSNLKWPRAPINHFLLCSLLTPFLVPPSLRPCIFTWKFLENHCQRASSSKQLLVCCLSSKQKTWKHFREFLTFPTFQSLQQGQSGILLQNLNTGNKLRNHLGLLGPGHSWDWGMFVSGQKCSLAVGLGGQGKDSSKDRSKATPYVLSLP